MKDMFFVLSGFLLCSFFLHTFFRVRATMNLQFFVTFITWSVFLYETIRLQYPALTLPQPYRHWQHRAEMMLLVVYGWEAVQYVAHKLVEKMSGPPD